MSKARLAGVPEDDAAIAFDCAPQTMREHYLAFDKTGVADRVFERIQDEGAPGGANGNGASERNRNGGAVTARQSPDEKRTHAEST